MHDSNSNQTKTTIELAVAPIGKIAASSGVTYTIVAGALVACPEELSPAHMFHKLWTACVGTAGYDKEQWRAIETQLRLAGVI